MSRTVPTMSYEGAKIVSASDYLERAKDHISGGAHKYPLTVEASMAQAEASIAIAELLAAIANSLGVLAGRAS